MIEERTFKRFLEEWQTFDSSMERIIEAVSGNRYGIDLYSTDWYNSVGIMLDLFIDSHFTEQGADIINYFLFETIPDKAIYVNQEKDMFNEEKEIRYPLETIDDLWNFLLTDVKLYFKNA